MNRNAVLGGLYIALAAVIFSTMEVLLKLPAVAGAFHPLQITMERFVVGGICLLPLALRALKKLGYRLRRKDLAFFALTGLFNIPLGMVVYQLAITHGQANVVAVIFSGNPIFVTVLAFLLLREDIHWNNLLALAAEVLGILAIVDPWGSGEISPLCILLSILAALFFSLYAVLGKKKTAKVGSIVVTCFSFLFGAAELFLLLLLGHTGPGAALYQAVGLDVFCDVPFLQGINTTTLPYFLFIGVVNCAGGYVFHMLAIEKTSATHGSLVFFFKPILAPLFALAVLGEAITRPIALGILCFLAGSLLSILPEVIREHRAKAAQLSHTEGTE
ncbi:MAG TPA: DMT family transporter [Candidatus Evtepia faecigallinarum]|nr:DMT family transporter [Candidatus Evtepia faecigallinarum]